MTEQDKNKMLLTWLKLFCTHEQLSDRIKRAGYSKIAVCGYREYGRIFVHQLMEEGMQPVCIIEKNYQSLREIEETHIPIVGFLDTEIINEAEVIIVTPDIAFSEVCEDLEMADIRKEVRSLEYFIL